mgnify:FL=1|tara:strand:- start:39575 stop:40573 length:999 start_codon:yes stop_codon:yes gene_type:complete
MVTPEFDIKRSVLVGDTADVYLQRTLTILRNEGVNPVVSIEFNSLDNGIFCGISEVKDLLNQVLPNVGSEVWSLEESSIVNKGEVALRVKAPYGAIGMYETAICGILASSTGWATAANECVAEAKDIPVIAFGARNIHPNVVMNFGYSAIKGGCVSCSTTAGSRISGVAPSGNMTHSLSLIMSSTLKAIEAFDKHMPREVPRVALVDTFTDESVEAVFIATEMGERLRGIRVDTPQERGGVTTDLVKEIRSRLNLEGFSHVDIMVTGGLNPERIREFVEAQAPVDSFGVGTFIASATPKPFRAGIKEIEGVPVAKRGRIPGLTPNTRLTRLI